MTKDIPENDAPEMEENGTSSENEGTTQDNSETSVEEELAILKDQLLRSMAELDNVRKRNDREKEDTAKYAVSAFARDILNVSDNLRRAIDAVPEGAADSDPALKALVDGVEITETELLNSIEKHGIKKISPELGDEFDHNLHQAMFEIETSDYKAGTIAQVMQDGYVIHDRLLRPAMVGVAKS